MFLICLLVIGLGILALTAIGMATFVSVAFCPETDPLTVNDPGMDKSGCRMLQAASERPGKPVITAS